VSGDSLLTQAIIYLGAAVVCVPIASRLRLGSVLGYLAAGCAIGPSGLRLAGDHGATLHFAEIGVVLMLFLIGLELDPRRLWTMRRAVFGGGGLQLLACASIALPALLALSLPWQAALVASVALALSSTAVSMQTMAEKNLLKTPVGQASFSVLLFQDMAAIPLLAVVPLLGGGAGAAGSGWHGAARALGAVVAVVVIGRFLTRPLLRVIAGTGLREVFTAFTLLLVLGIAAVMALAGISMALGAFLAGVLLASSEYRHALETDIEPFKGLLMGLFFIAVGMSIDFGLLATRPVLVLGLVCGYQVLKGLALRLVAGGVGVDRESRWLFAALLAQGGEFAFVVFGVARTGGVLPGDWDALLTLTVALSMALTPVLLMLERRWMRPVRGEREPDRIENEGAHVIIAGFGRFGQIVGRLLFASGVKATVLDHDPEHIEVIRRFDFRVYYGDAARLDLLEAAGAAEATVLVNAIDDPDTSLRLVEAVQEHFPKLAVVARARNVGHYHALRSRGLEVVERETFESALLLGQRTLTLLGVGPYEARERADRFRRQNIASLESILPHWQDEKLRRQMARTARQQLEEQMQLDRAALDELGGRGWHED
jgi:glutathione-regulated potassium-efflux system ancillary protein KefC